MPVRSILAMLLAVGLSGPEGTPAAAQATPQRPPVIDVHVHSTTTTPQDLARLDALNVRFIVLSGLSADLATWSGVDPARYLPGLVMPCDRGRALFVNRPCWDGESNLPDLGWLREQVQGGRVKALGEMVPQALGMAPDDARLEPYWQLAEEFDIPVAIHMGPGPPGAAYDSSPAPFKLPAFGMALGDPLLLEPVLLRHKRLRLFVMHAGWPRLESMVALLYAHPGVYVDVGALQAPFMVPRGSYLRHLQGLVEAGFGQRIMFGSDFPSQLEPGIAAIMNNEFLTPDQKTDILCRNASRFFRLGEDVCASR